LSFVFDLLALDGEDLRERPLLDRKGVLQRVLGAGTGVLQPVHFLEGSPAALVDAVNELELEGVVSKWGGSRYNGRAYIALAEARFEAVGQGMAG
jgi:bifunctional non-homologous end joining protein LigD